MSIDRPLTRFQHFIEDGVGNVSCQPRSNSRLSRSSYMRLKHHEVWLSLDMRPGILFDELLQIAVREDSGYLLPRLRIDDLIQKRIAVDSSDIRPNFVTPGEHRGRFVG
jgi:hypothetical protein